MRILHIITSADPRGGGPIEGAIRFGERWVESGHQYHLLTLDPPEEQHMLPSEFEVIALGPPLDRKLLNRYRYSPRMIPWLQQNAHNYDAIIVSGLWRYQTRGAQKALAGGSVPYFVYTHGMLDPWFKKTHPIKHLGKQLSWWFAEGPLLANAEAVLFTCEEEKLLAENAFWPYHANGIPSGFGTADVSGDPAMQIAAFRATIPQLGDRPYLLFLSRIHRKKGCDLLVDAFAHVAAQQPDLQLVFAGPDSTNMIPALTAQAKKLGIADRVHFPGMIVGDAKYGAFRDAEAFVLTSHQENFGIVVAEAMACEIPVLISDKVNIWREIVEGDAGLVEPDTPEGSRRLLARFMAMPRSERKAMGQRARQCFLKKFRIEEVADRLMDFLQERVRK